MDVWLDWEYRVVGIFFCLFFKDKFMYIEFLIKVYDDMVFWYLFWIFFLFLGCYVVYSFLYLEYKGWYFWVFSMFYGFLLIFGFIIMMFQFFINYKFKFVVYLLWCMFIYKVFNIFIDDLFVFVIKMFVMYWIGCLWDDVVFFIYFY